MEKTLSLWLASKNPAVIIREAVNGDIPAIVNLLRISLGERLMPKSERYWRWKHLENPFGQSPVLLCFHRDQLVGVRSFMRWEWEKDGEIYRSLRAVDTATHPDFQGKGIFKKLTLQLVEQAAAGGCRFIFNTPNALSKPGYLKMGWEEAGRVVVRIGVRQPWGVFKQMFPRRQTTDSHADSQLRYYLEHPGLSALIARNRSDRGMIRTHTSKEYLLWRYAKVPVADYIAVGTGNEEILHNLIIGRLKQSRFGREFRITDYFLGEPSANRHLRTALNKKFRSLGVDHFTVSGVWRGDRLFRGMSVKIGPSVTIRHVQATDMRMLRRFSEWSPSLGDLELF